jgi:hypothetical protein
MRYSACILPLLLFSSTLYAQPAAVEAARRYRAGYGAQILGRFTALLTMP